VVAHTDRIALWDVTYRVSEAGRLRVLRNCQKNVHAFVVGKIIESFPNQQFTTCAVTYNPYNSGTFVTLDGRPITKSTWAILDVEATRKVLAIFPK